MSVIRQDGPYSILEEQPSRLALPWAWAIGFVIAGADAWIYHLLAYLFLVGAALCLYGSLILFLPNHASFAFSVVVLSVLWPADPTRYDAATLGNRQALFLMMAGALLYLLAWRYRRRLWLLGSVALLTASLLTYEAHVLLIGVLPLIILADARRPSGRWRQYLLAAAAPMLVFAAVNAATTLTGGESYRARLLDASWTHVTQQMAAGLQMLFVDSWRGPIDLLRAGLVPDLVLVRTGTLVFAAWVFVLVVREISAREVRLSRPSWPLLTVGLVSTALALAIFALSKIPMSQPDRTQTYSLMGGAIVLCTSTWLLLSRLPGHRIAYVIVSTVFVALAFSMASIYQRNFRDSWREQELLLNDITRQAPGLTTGTLVLVTGLPDTRIIFPSAYTCAYALMELYNHTHVYASSYRVGRDMVVSRSIHCGLIFDGSDLDPWTNLEFEQGGVRYSFADSVATDQPSRFEYLFPYDRVVVFKYSEHDGALLLGAIPSSLSPTGTSPNAYNPSALITTHDETLPSVQYPAPAPDGWIGPRFPVTFRGPARDRHLRLSGQILLPPGLPYPAHVFLEDERGEVVTDRVPVPDEGPFDLSLTIPASAFAAGGETAATTLYLMSDRPYRPVDHGVSADTRELLMILTAITEVGP